MVISAARLWRVATIPRPLAGYRQKQVAGNSINLLIINVLQKTQSVPMHLLPARGRVIVATRQRRAAGVLSDYQLKVTLLYQFNYRCYADVQKAL
jgi:hypothetical protein